MTPLLVRVPIEAGVLAALLVAVCGALLRRALWPPVRARARCRVLPVATPDERPARAHHSRGATFVAVPLGVMTGGAMVVASTGSPLLGCVGVMTVLAVRSGLRVHRRRAAERVLRRSLPDVLEQLTSSIRSGANIVQALGECARLTRGPLGDQLREVTGRIDRGEATHTALDRWAASTDDRGVALTVASLATALELGGSLGPSLDAVAATMRDRISLDDELRSLATQAVFSAVVMAVSPFVFVVIAVGLEPRIGVFLLSTGVGNVCLALGVGLDLAGAAWMARIVRLR